MRWARAGMVASIRGRCISFFGPLRSFTEVGRRTCYPKRLGISALCMNRVHQGNVTIGRKGGRARSERKSLAARQNALLRWHERDGQGVIPVKALIDGAWYQGQGRTSPLAIWDGHAKSFHTVGLNSFSDPENYPAISRRNVRLKQESHIALPGGSFAPMHVIAI